MATMNDAAMRENLACLHKASYGWALHCCDGDASRAEDVVQGVYLRVLQGRVRFSGRSTFKTWLFGVIRLTAANERRKDLYRFWKLEHHHQRRGNRATVSEPDALLSERERADYFLEALQSLSRRQREVLHLVFYQEMTLEEAARVMRTTVGSASKHYDRGKTRMRQLLEGTEWADERQQEQPA